ncbi:MAG: Gfo/Idh/MocA family oxidoreductase [Gemmatimonadota bacterium]|nr:MAG: Gfo/Idh/MocA family oxidoreductase [Gemmatimonadota bacterium]
MTPYGPAIGVIGAGSLGFQHARILAGLDGARMAGVFDLDPARSQQAATQLGVSVHESMDALLSVATAVVVAVPTLDHEAVATAALERGLHVLIEKPIAPTLEAADRILAAAEASGVVVQVGHVERFNRAVLAAEPYLDEPLFIESHRLASFDPRGTDVAVVLDLMIHDVDLVQSLVGGDIRDIAATGIPVFTDTVDIASARLSFEGGAVANLTASRVSVERMRKLRIFQASGYLSLDLADGSGEFLRLKHGLPAFSAESVWEGAEDEGLASLVERVPLVGEEAEPLAKELENFRDAVQGVTPPVVTGRDGRSALAVSLAIEERIKAHVANTYSA